MMEMPMDVFWHIMWASSWRGGETPRLKLQDHILLSSSFPEEGYWCCHRRWYCFFGSLVALDGCSAPSSLQYKDLFRSRSRLDNFDEGLRHYSGLDCQLDGWLEVFSCLLPSMQRLLRQMRWPLHRVWLTWKGKQGNWSCFQPHMEACCIHKPTLQSLQIDYNYRKITTVLIRLGAVSSSEPEL